MLSRSFRFAAYPRLNHYQGCWMWKRNMPGVAGNIADRIESLDLSLFDSIETQSSDGDRLAWLAVQRAMRQPSGYVYLEIGSHLGGSLQQHLADPLCRGIVSIDKRPLSQPDDRGKVYHYEGNSTARMLDNLRRIAPEQLGKVTCFDADASEIDPQKIELPPTFCFIDGEHTEPAVLSDFEFCLKVCADDAAICFHDDKIIHPALGSILSSLRTRGIPFTARKLTGVTFGIFLRKCPVAHDPYVLSHSTDAALWLRLQRLRQCVPGWLRPLARRLVRVFKRQG